MVNIAQIPQFLSKEYFLNKKEQVIAGKKLLSQIEYIVSNQDQSQLFIWLL
jgi:hypothetical protein